MRKSILKLVVLNLALVLSSCDKSTIFLDKNIKTAQQAVLEKLNDPQSARFENVVKNGEIVCGWVNGKNSFGGYSGFAHFIYKDGMAKISQDEYPDWLSDFNECVRESKNEKASSRLSRESFSETEKLEEYVKARKEQQAQ